MSRVTGAATKAKAKPKKRAPPKGRIVPKRRAPTSHRRLLPIALRAGAAVLVVGAVVIGWTSGEITRAGEGIGQGFVSTTASFGFRIADISVEGRIETDPAALLAAIGAGRGDPILGFSPEAARQAIEQIPWVAEASVQRRLPDTVHVVITERRPIAIWQNAGKLSLIDRDGTDLGKSVGGLSEFRDLPLVVGPDAPRHAQEMLDALKRQPDLAQHVQSLSYVGQRRWDLALGTGQTVKLPEQGVPAALKLVADAVRDQKLLDRNIQIVDLRLPGRMVVQTNPQPAPDATAKKHSPAKDVRAGQGI